MSEWQNFKLREVGTLQRGRSRHRPRYAFHLFNGPYPFIQTGEVREARKYVSTFENTYSEAGLAQSKLWPKGTLCITIAANIAELAILGFDACFPDSVLGFIPDETRSDLDFVYYTLTHFQKQLKHIGEGSVQDNINLGTFEDIEFPFPPLPEQKAIASVLSSLDDKIDLLHRQNKTLEAMAETLFRQWFIEEAKEDWEEADLTQLIELQSGYAFKSKDFQESGSFGVIKIKNISGNIIDIGQTDFVADEIGLATAQRFHVKSGQVLIAMTGAEIGKLGLIPKTTKQLLLNQRVGLLVPRFKGAEYLAYLHLKSEFGQDYIENSATGSAQPNISGSLIEACPFPSIDNELLRQCGMQVQIYYEKVKENLGQIQTLENLRDTLLPKLMSGEVRVQYQTEEVA